MLPHYCLDLRPHPLHSQNILILCLSSSATFPPSLFLLSFLPILSLLFHRLIVEPSSLDSTRHPSQKDGGGGGPTGTDRGPSAGGVASPPPMWHLPTIIGWRESIVRRKVFCCLTKATPKVLNRLSSNFSLDIDAIQSGALQLADVFPRCNETPPEIPNRTANGIAYRANNGRT